MKIILCYFDSTFNNNDMENIKQLAKSNWPSMVIALPAFAATVYAIVTEIINRF